VRALPLIDAYVPAVGQRVPFIDGTMRHPDRGDSFWAGTDVGAAADRLRVPTLIVAGWQDLLLDQNLHQYARLRAAGCPSALLIGPWTHTNAFDKGAPVVVGESLAWLRAHLRGDGEPRATPVRVHVSGVDEWRDYAEWPPPGTTVRPLYLHPGTLDEAAPEGDAVVGRFRYDPHHPTPSVGGPLLSRTAGVRDNGALEARPDVLTFTTNPLERSVEVIGPVTATLRVSAKPGARIDLFARLCDVDGAGRSSNVCDGLLRLPAFTAPDPATGEALVEATVDLVATAHQFRPGHRIRLQVSGGAHPRFARNTGTGEPVATATRLVATDVAVHSGSTLCVSTVVLTS
jgi:putative CocE/NonD family hydrolase